MKKQSVPSFIVAQTMVITSFLLEFSEKSLFMPEPTPAVKRNISQKKDQNGVMGVIHRENSGLVEGMVD